MAKILSPTNIIFLDVDGVLNNMAYLKGKDTREEIDMQAVERLAEIYKECDCRIVLSSSWRELCGSETKEHHSMYRYLEDCLGKYGMEIMDVTPVIMSNRPEEIAAWLKKNVNMVKNFVSLDDDFDEKITKVSGLAVILLRLNSMLTMRRKAGCWKNMWKRRRGY